jgi:hypothetical protein
MLNYCEIGCQWSLLDAWMEEGKDGRTDEGREGRMDGRKGVWVDGLIDLDWIRIDSMRLG